MTWFLSFIRKNYSLFHLKNQTLKVYNFFSLDSLRFATATNHHILIDSFTIVQSKIEIYFMIYIYIYIYIYLCVCVCVFILFNLLASSDYRTSVTYLRCSDQRSFVVSIARGFCQVPSSPFPNLLCFISKDVTPVHRKAGKKAI